MSLLNTPTRPKPRSRQIEARGNHLFLPPDLTHSAQWLKPVSIDVLQIFGDRLTWASDQIEIHVLKDGSRIVTGYQGQMMLSE